MWAPYRKAETERVSRALPEMSWNEIDRPGCYIVLESGSLIRVPASGFGPNRRLVVRFVSNRDVRLARLSGNPEAPLSVVRAIATARGLFADF